MQKWDLGASGTHWGVSGCAFPLLFLALLLLLPTAAPKSSLRAALAGHTLTWELKSLSLVKAGPTFRKSTQKHALNTLEGI